MINNNDSFISDDEEDVCPLCVEEMDISDKNFKPCPCGYQICQFCYNNIRQNPELNGRCPACRRVYDDESVEYKVMTPEELRLEQSKQSRREKERKQREKERKENEQANRKHLAGMRVIQKNLVYVLGLNPQAPSDELHSLLRSDKYFGQYGKILKIVINRRNAPNAPGTFGQHNGPNSAFGVYVTFSKKEEAQRCINEIDGSYIDGRQLKAAFGTTKYCSSYLRGQSCPNPNCMFLHEPGEEADSYTRQDLSTRQGLKMDDHQDFRPAPFQRFPSSSQSVQNGQHEEGVSVSTTSPVAHQPILNAVPLPATSSWANPASALPKSGNNDANNNSTLADTSAFPTLAEATTLLQQQQHQAQLAHQQQQLRQKQKQQFNDEFDLESCTNSFIEDTAHFLGTLNGLSYKLKPVDFNTEQYPTLFANDFTITQTSPDATFPSSVEPRSFTVKLVHSLFKPIPQPPSAAVQQQMQQAHNAQYGIQQAPPPSQQEIQQQQLLQQQLLQHQQLQLQQQQIKGTPTIPPPGLFNHAEQFAPQQPQQPQHLPQHQAQQGGNGGAASELLSHLMNGKKISS